MWESRSNVCLTETRDLRLSPHRVNAAEDSHDRFRWAGGTQGEFVGFYRSLKSQDVFKMLPLCCCNITKLPAVAWSEQQAAIVSLLVDFLGSFSSKYHSDITRLTSHQYKTSSYFLPQGEALRQILVNRYYGNFHPRSGRRDSLTAFTNGPLSPVGPGKNQSGEATCLLAL